MGAHPNVINLDILLPAWKESVKPIKVPQVLSENRKVANM